MTATTVDAPAVAGPADADSTTIARVTDAVGDIAVVAFAGWTLLAFLAMKFQIPVTPLLVIWLVLTAGIAVVVPRRRARERRAARPAPTHPSFAEPAPVGEPAGPLATAGPRWARQLVYGSFALAAISGLIAIKVNGVAWYLSWFFGAAVVAAALVMLLRYRSTVRDLGWPDVAAPLPASLGSDLFALVTSLGLGIFSLFVVHPDLDDVFYVNRAASVADLGKIPVRDVLLAQEQFRPVAGTGSPVDTWDPLEGAFGHLFSAHGATIAYEFATPIMTVLALGALWRLIRCWAPRRAWLCYAIAVVFLMMDGAEELNYGNYFLSRMWQGKVVLVAWLLPLIMCYLTEWVRRETRLTAGLIVSCGVAGIGLSSTGAFDVPLAMGVGVVPLLLAKRWRSTWPLILAAVFAVVAGAIGNHIAPASVIQEINLRTPQQTFQDVIGLGTLAALGAIAIWGAPWLVRDRAAGLVAISCALIAVGVFAPGVLRAAHSVLSVGGVLRRVLFVVPVPAFVGLLGGLQLPRWPVLRLRWAWAALPAVLIIGMINRGDSVIDYHYTRIASSPSWKVYTVPNQEAMGILAHIREGRLVAPADTMSAVAIASGAVRTVNPRGLYTKLIPQPNHLNTYRFTLSNLATFGLSSLNHPEQIGYSLKILKVGWVCLPQISPDAISYIHRLGYTHRQFTTNGLECDFRPYGKNERVQPTPAA